MTEKKPPRIVTEISRLLDSFEDVSELMHLSDTFVKKADELLDRDIKKAQSFIRTAESRKNQIRELFPWLEEGPLYIRTTPKEISKAVKKKYLPTISGRFTSSMIKDFVVQEFQVPEEYRETETEAGTKIFNNAVRKAMSYLVKSKDVKRLNNGEFTEIKKKKVPDDDFFNEVK